MVVSELILQSSIPMTLVKRAALSTNSGSLYVYIYVYTAHTRINTLTIVVHSLLAYQIQSAESIGDVEHLNHVEFVQRQHSFTTNLIIHTHTNTKSG